jgi:hypothetical protein
MTEKLESHIRIGPTISLELHTGNPQVSCEGDFLKRVEQHTENATILCNSQMLFLYRAATELEGIIDRRLESARTHDDRSEIAMLEVQAMSYRVRSRLIGETCAPQDVRADLQVVFDLPTHTS